MTATDTRTIPAQQTVTRNPFADSLKRGFNLSQEEIDQVVVQMRDCFPHQLPCELLVPPRRMTPNTQALEPEEKALIRAEVDESNAARQQRIAAFFSFLGEDLAQLLANKVRREITGFVIRQCTGDNFYTLIPEH